MVKSSSR
jgi:phosphatidylserine decarboxylase